MEKTSVILILFALMVSCGQTSRKSPPDDVDHADHQNQPAIERQGKNLKKSDEELLTLFTQQNTSIRLLPYEVRLSKLRFILDEFKIDNRLLKDMQKNAERLGKSDFANGIAQNDNWSPQQIVVWAEGLRPVCSAPETHAALKDTASLGLLMSMSFGRRISEAEVEEFVERLGDDIGSDQYKTVACLAILSSLEMVVR